MRVATFAFITSASLVPFVLAACPSSCSLNGVCEPMDTNASGSARCVCDPPWSGADCGTINVAPAAPGGLYGYNPNVSSWGGNSVLGDDGQWHLFVAEMAKGGLQGWGHFSECTHAVGRDMQGPFTKVGEALPMWCHNPYTIRDPKTGIYPFTSAPPNSKRMYYLFHIGSGNDTRSHDFMHYSHSPHGPWTAAPTKPASCNNPAPMFHPNGTLFLVCSHNYISSASHHPLDPANTYTTWPMAKVGPSTDPDRHWEDPSLWFDKRGLTQTPNPHPITLTLKTQPEPQPQPQPQPKHTSNQGNWHVLYHVYCLKPFKDHKECMSGHAYSRDGRSWVYSNTEPFNGTVTFTDDSPPITFSTRERPHLVFGVDDLNMTTPIGVTSGVSSQQPSPACDSCRQGACSQCKITTGRDWTYTVLQPFEGFSAPAATATK